MTGNPASTLAQSSDVSIDCQVSEEACPLNLVPTASTTAALAMGDALCMTLLVEKGFKEEDFAKIHPGGKLGKKLMRVDQLMHKGLEAPIVKTDTPMSDVIYEMSKKALGMTCVVDGADRLVGIITDGDLRR
jgi:arabinose-5-phosphate isomerase